jgi:hypothetical protein
MSSNGVRRWGRRSGAACAGLACAWTVTVAAWGLLTLRRVENGIGEATVAALVCAAVLAGYALARGLSELAKEMEGR